MLRLNVAGFKQGNIILDVIVRDHNEVTLQDIADLCDLEDAHEPEAWESALLEQVDREDLQILQIDSSYGGTCQALAKSIELLDRGEWMKRYMVQR